MTYEEQRTQLNKNKNKLDYKYISVGDPIPDPTTFRIQPSSISKFLDDKSQWYREKLLGEPSSFDDSTSSVLGTCIHYLAEQYIKHGTISAEDKSEIYSYIALKASDLICPDTIKAQMTSMWTTLRNYLDVNPVALAEPKVELLINPGVLLAGSIDAIRILNEEQVKSDGTAYKSIEELRGKHVQIIDWKTTGALTAPTKIARGYFFQLLAYAYILDKKYGITVVQINNTYLTRNNVNRPSPTNPAKTLKDYPSLVSSVDLPITDYNLIGGLANVIVDSVEAFVNKPELRYLLASDYRLKLNVDKLPFVVGVQKPVVI